MNLLGCKMTNARPLGSHAITSECKESSRIAMSCSGKMALSLNGDGGCSSGGESAERTLDIGFARHTAHGT
jgi:hypothetical protein